MSTTIVNQVDRPKVELPLVEAVEPKKHISYYLMEEGLKQVNANLVKLDESIKKHTEQLGQLQATKIAATGQKNLLEELYKKVKELDVPTPNE